MEAFGSARRFTAIFPRPPIEPEARHTLVHTIVRAVMMTIFIGLSRIVSLGAIFVTIDIAAHWGRAASCS